MNEDGGFLSRWSRRKVQVREGVAPVEPDGVTAVQPLSQAIPQPGLQPTASADQPATVAAPQAPAETTALPLPTMDDVARLTRESDFSAYAAPGVDASVQHAAMKKLFADPRYNVMDGLDVYIDDYSKPSPIPPALLRKMHQVVALKLFDDEPATPDTPASTPAPGAESPPATNDLLEGAADEDPDLRLQQDPAAGRAGATESPGA